MPRPDLLLQFRDPDGGIGEPIEGKQVGTVAAHGYRVKRKRLDTGRLDTAGLDTAGQAPNGMRVYVDPATDLPVRVEEEVDLPMGGKRQRTVVVLSDFEWDIPVDPSLLSLDPPAGYRRQKLGPDLDGPAPAEAVAAGLRFYAEQMEGALPTSLDGFEPLASLQAAVFARLGTQNIKETATLDMAAKLEFATEQFGPWFGLTKGMEDLAKKKIPLHYLGKGVKAGEGSRIVAWWRAETPGRVIAIRGDFSSREIDESAAPPPAGGSRRRP